MKQIKSVATGINLIIGLILINLFLGFYPFLRIDLTKNKIHSLSSASKEMVKNLDDVVQIKVYISQELPPEVKSLADGLNTIVDELSRLNASKIRVSKIDPLEDKKLEQEAVKMGIQPLQFSTVKDDKFEVSNGYLGLALIYGDEKAVLPVASDIGNLEYFLVSNIKRLTNPETKKVALVDNVSTDQSKINYLTKYLGQDYQIVDLGLDKEELNQEAEGLVWLGNNKALEPEKEEKVEQWLEGKSLLALVDGVEVDGTTMNGNLVDKVNLSDYLANSGIKIDKKLALDKSSTIANFRSEQGAFISQYPYWIEITPENFNKEIPAVSGLSGLMLPWVSPIELGDGAETLFTSSKNSWTDKTASDLSPLKVAKADSFEANLVLGAINKDKRVAVVADSDFISDDFVANKQNNLILALNLVDYLMADESLLQVRSKSIASYPLVTLDKNKKMMVRYGNLVLPIIITGLAILLVSKIRQKKQNYEE